MTPMKWYEMIWVSMVFTPFRWRLKFTWEPYWHQGGIDIGPLTIGFGWPEFKRDALGDSF